MSTALGQKVRGRSSGGGNPSFIRAVGYSGGPYTPGSSVPIRLEAVETTVTGSVGEITADLSDPTAPMFHVPVTGIYRVALDVGYHARDVDETTPVNEPLHVALFFGTPGLRLAAKLRCAVSEDTDNTHWWVEDGFCGDTLLYDDGDYFPYIEVQYMGGASGVWSNAAFSITYVGAL